MACSRPRTIEHTRTSCGERVDNNSLVLSTAAFNRLCTSFSGESIPTFRQKVASDSVMVSSPDSPPSLCLGLRAIARACLVSMMRSKSKPLGSTPEAVIEYMAVGTTMARHSRSRFCTLAAFAAMRNFLTRWNATLPA